MNEERAMRRPIMAEVEQTHDRKRFIGFLSTLFSSLFYKGSYKCGPCNPGFIGDGYAGCYPGDLCTNSSHTCHVNALCVNLGSGNYKCQVWGLRMLQIVNGLVNFFRFKKCSTGVPNPLGGQNPLRDKYNEGI